MNLLGIHHITAIASNAQKNYDFYTNVLGLRFVKKTVNFDDPYTYHLYYGDTTGHPGTALTFFPWKEVPNGKRGTGQATAIGFTIPEQAVDYWKQRLTQKKIKLSFSERFRETVLSFEDPDGLLLELIATPLAKHQADHGWNEAVPEDYSVKGFHSVTLTQEGYEDTAKLLEKMGFEEVSEENNRHRFKPKIDAIPATFVDIVCSPDAPPGQLGHGTIHHVAYRTKDDETEKKDREELSELHRNPTHIIDRNYFHSIYFREPGGILFEIATDNPGFTVDEPEQELGTHLKLPAWFEDKRADIEKELQPLEGKK